MKNSIYLCRVEWYDDVKGKNRTSTAFVVAPTYMEAVNMVTSEFIWVNNVYAELVEEGNVLFVPNNKDLIDEIKNANYY